MAEQWNPATGNLEKKEETVAPWKQAMIRSEEQKVVQKQQNKQDKLLEEEEAKKQRKKEYFGRAFGTLPKTTITKKGKVVSHGNLFATTRFSKSFGIGRPRKQFTKRDELKILRFRNRIEKEKLRNALDRYKIMHKIELARKQGKLVQPAMSIMQQPMMPQRKYPYFSSPVEQQDLDSGFSADIQHGDASLWGTENYHEEQFYNENFFLDELSLSPFQHLNIKPVQGVSPLLW